MLAGAWSPSWSSRGRLAFEREVDGRYQVATSRPDGSDLRVVADDVCTAQARPRWSPGGKLLSYVRQTAAGPVVEVASADGSGEHAVATGALEPAWRPATPLPRRSWRAC